MTGPSCVSWPARSRGAGYVAEGNVQGQSVVPLANHGVHRGRRRTASWRAKSAQSRRCEITSRNTDQVHIPMAATPAISKAFDRTPRVLADVLTGCAFIDIPGSRAGDELGTGPSRHDHSYLS